MSGAQAPVRGDRRDGRAEQALEPDRETGGEGPAAGAREGCAARKQRSISSPPTASTARRSRRCGRANPLAEQASKRFTQALADVAEVLTPAQRKQIASAWKLRPRWRHG